MRSFVCFTIIAAACAAMSGCVTLRPCATWTPGQEPVVNLYFDIAIHGKDHNNGC